MAAQSAAHLATSNVDRPSIFELVASSSLDQTFHPALKKIATVRHFRVVYLRDKYLFFISLAVFGDTEPRTLSGASQTLRRTLSVVERHRSAPLSQEKR
jgi:hypothetical protein